MVEVGRDSGGQLVQPHCSVRATCTQVTGDHILNCLLILKACANVNKLIGLNVFQCRKEMLHFSPGMEVKLTGAAVSSHSCFFVVSRQ